MKNLFVRETRRPTIFLVNLYFMKFMIVILLFLLAHQCTSQKLTGGLLLQNMHTNKTKFFPNGTKVRITMRGVPSFRGKIIAVSDSSFTIIKAGVPKYNMTLSLDKIEAIAKAKKTFPVIFGSAMIFSGSITFINGINLANTPDTPGFIIFSNRAVGGLEQFCGALLMGGGIPLVWPKKNYKTSTWKIKLIKE